MDNGDIVVVDETNNKKGTQGDVEIVETKKSISKRTTGGRVITGDACEYIMLCDIINNVGCDDGEDDEHENRFIDEIFRKQVCCAGEDWGKKTILDPEWKSSPGICPEEFQVYQL